MIQLLSDISKNFPFSTDIKELRHFVNSKHKARPKRKLDVNGEIIEVAEESMISRTPSELQHNVEEKEMNPFRTGKATFFTESKKMSSLDEGSRQRDRELDKLFTASSSMRLNEQFESPKSLPAEDKVIFQERKSNLNTHLDKLLADVRTEYITTKKDDMNQEFKLFMQLQNAVLGSGSATSGTCSQIEVA